MWNFWKRKTWNNRRIAFVGILIATSVAFVLISSTIAPIAALPTFKIMAGGLPVKITGYIFGPVIGMVTGIISDLISFTLRPIAIHFYYTLAFACDGIIPGVVGFLMNRRWKYPSVAQPPQDKEKYNNVNFAITLFCLLVAMGAITIFTWLQPDGVFEEANSVIRNRFLFLGIILFGSASLFVGLIVLRFIFKPSKFNAMLPLIVFSAFLELTLSPLIALGDVATLGAGEEGNFIVFLTAHFMFSPIKAWGNLIIISFAYKIIAPLIYSKTSNSWETNNKNVKPPVKLAVVKSHQEKEADIKAGIKNKKD